jgi:hypothetical protein
MTFSFLNGFKCQAFPVVYMSQANDLNVSGSLKDGMRCCDPSDYSCFALRGQSLTLDISDVYCKIWGKGQWWLQNAQQLRTL